MFTMHRASMITKRFAAASGRQFSSPSIGFVGLGAMGSGMAMNLAKNGATPAVWDMYAPAVDKAVGNGCTAAESAAAAFSGADIVFTSLPRSVDVEALVESLVADGALKEGAVWVDTTSGVPDVSQRIHAKLAEDAGVAFLDCGVAGGPVGENDTQRGARLRIACLEGIARALDESSSSSYS